MRHSTRTLRRLRPPLILLAGFGGLLSFLLAAAVGTLVMLERVRNDDISLRQSSVERLAALEEIRSQIYLASGAVRDFVLSPGAGDRAEQRARLSAIEAETRTLLDRYTRSLDPGQEAGFQALRSEIEMWWEVVHGTFGWTPRQREDRHYAFFYEQLVPRRTTMLQIADEIGGINQRRLASAEDRFAKSALRLRWSLAVTFAVTLLGGLILALMAGFLTIRLDRELEKRRQDLQELSARLVSMQEEERRMLARELHDEVGQSLSAIMMEASNAQFAQGVVEMRERAQSIGTLAEKTLNVVRDLALLLRPSMLDDFGLVPALHWHAREMTRRTGIIIRVTAGEDCDELPEDHKTCVYRLVQEAANNSARHGRAQNVQVTVARTGDRVLLTVADDGIGFDKKSVRGMGLLGMEERVRRLGGKLFIDAIAGRGTTITAELPLPADFMKGSGAGSI